MNAWFRLLEVAIVIGVLVALLINFVNAMAAAVKRPAKIAVCMCGAMHEESEIGLVCPYCQFRIEDYETVQETL